MSFDGVEPRFTAVHAGNVTGDDYPDLYFGDNDDAPGSGGADLNQDGRLDIVRDRGLGQQITLIYNDPEDVGVFDPMQTINLGQPYYTSVGDLNNDDLLDLIVSPNSTDRYLLSQGVRGDDVVQWGTGQLFQYLTDGDDGFGEDSYVADLDRDDFRGMIIADVDPQVPGCSRRMHIYRNTGGLAGSQVTPREKAQQQSGGGLGVVGMLPVDLGGVHHVAIFDIDGDDDFDMVLGRCSGTNVWMNVTSPPDKNAFYLVVPHNTSIEGSYGRDGGGGGGERPASGSACYPQSIGSCE